MSLWIIFSPTFREALRSLFSFSKERKVGRRKIKRVQPWPHSFLSGSSIKLSISIIPLTWCDAWAVLSLTLWLLPSRLTRLFLDSKDFFFTWIPTDLQVSGLKGFGLCLASVLFIYNFSVALLRFLVSENIRSVSFNKVLYSFWKDLIFIFFRTVTVICNGIYLYVGVKRVEISGKEILIHGYGLLILIMADQNMKSVDLRT